MRNNEKNKKKKMNSRVIAEVSRIMIYTYVVVKPKENHDKKKLHKHIHKTIIIIKM